MEYEDGETDLATGDAAEQIKRWYDGCEAMACVHGAKYSGPQFTRLTAQESKKRQGEEASVI
jgi:hypothetical protein